MSRLSAWCVIVYAALALRGHVPAQQPAPKSAPDSAAQAAAAELLLADAALEKHLYDGAVKRYIDYLSRHGAIADPRSVHSLFVAVEKEDWRQLDAVVASLRHLVNDHAGTPAAAAAWQKIAHENALLSWRYGQAPAIVRPGHPVRVRVSSASRAHQASGWHQRGPAKDERKALPKYALFRIPAAAYRAALAKLQDNRTQPFSHSDLERLWRQVPRDKWQPIKVATKLYRPDAELDWSDYGEDVLEADLRSVGPYVLEQEIDGFRRQDLLRAASFGLLCQSLGGQALVYSVDPWSGEPAPGVDVVLHTEKVTSAGRTDKRGLLLVDVPFSDAAEPALVMASRGEEFLSCELHGTRPHSPEEHAYITTDRPIYRPGQTVHFKAVLRECRGTALKRPTRRAVPVEIRDDEGHVLQRQELTWSEFGSLSGSFVIGDEPRLGTYHVVVGIKQPARRVDPQEFADPSEQWRGLWRQSFRVQAYRKPEFSVQVQTAGGTALTGARLRASIRAEYYFGGPVADAEVTWRVTSLSAWEDAQSHWQIIPWDDPRRWFYEGQSALTPEEDPNSDSTQTVVGSGTGRTAKDGSLEIEVETKPSRWPVEYHVEAEVRDASRLTARGEARVEAQPSALRVQVGTPRRFYEPGDTISAGVRVTTHDGRPAANRDVALALFLAGEGTGGKEFESFFSTTLRTDAEGRSLAKVKAPRDGILRLRAQVRDDRGRLAQARCDLWIAGDAAVDEDPNLNQREEKPTADVPQPPYQVTLVSDCLAYEPGETVRLLARCTRPPCAGLLTVGAGTWREQRVVHLKKKCQVIELPVPADDTPYVKVDLTTWQQGNVAGDVADFFVFPGKQVLDVHVATDRGQYAPRQTAQVTIRTRASDGRPVAAEVELGIVDESLFSLAKDRSVDPRVFFFAAYPSDASISQHVAPHFDFGTQDDPFGNGYLRRGAAGSQIDFSASRFLSYGTQTPFVVSVIPVLNGGGALGAAGGGGGGGFFGDGGGAGGALADTETRANFADTFYWSAHVRTNGDGQATLNLKVPDTLSSWRIVARAVAGDDRFGWAKSGTVTRKDVMVRLAAPRFYTQRDEGTVSTIVHNELQAETAFLVRLTVSGAEGGGERRVTVPPRGQRRLDWPLKITHVAPVQLKAEALSTAASDAMTLTLPVRPYGVRARVAQSGVVSPQWTARLLLPKHAGAETARLELYTGGPPMAIRDALPHLAEYPYGCVEQTMSRFLPAIVAAQSLKRLGLQNERLEADLPGMVQQGLQRLYGFHHSDGGWGWWEKDESNDFMTAYVVYGLLLARQAGHWVDPQTLENGLKYVRNAEQTPFSLYVRRLSGGDVDRLVREWKADAAGEQALLVLAGRKDLAGKLQFNHKGRVGPDDVRTAALIVRALASVDRHDARIGPLVEWLMTQRQGGLWFSTLDTAYVVLALADLAERERGPVVEASLNGRPLELRSGQAKVSADQIRSGENVLVVRSGGGVVFASAVLSYFTSDLEAATARAAKPSDAEHDNALPILQRRFEKAVVKDGQETWQPLASGGSVKVSDRLRVVVRASASAAVRQVMIESPLAAGTEAHEKRDPDPEDDEEHWSYWYCRRELRDDRVSVAAQALGHGPQEFEFYLRPTLPGTYHVLPAEAFAMYEPSRRGFSPPFVVRVETKGDE